jgi:hypothetical protein
MDLLRNKVWGCELNRTGSEQGLAAGSWQHGNELSVYMKGEEFIHRLTNCHLLKKNPVQ